MIDKGDTFGLGQLRRGIVEWCVLALLQHHERYGFELAKTLSAANLIASEGTIYPLLARLRRDGLVETLWRESAEGPPRRYYVLTTSGKQSLQLFRNQWQQFKESVDQFLDEGTREEHHDHLEPK
ncbi:PadR family transcriptional regulator [Sulfobacillus thermosulfidooxidans]|uniref:PadR family transcriptional regulator n=1 Tax=Sulfobacillus thermosulfidooxidans TaxID=28034 RepID=UPI0006B644E8|nr:PadR family transcriptional regulator [Sulfobacillus thermosulfidooxidans]